MPPYEPTEPQHPAKQTLVMEAKTDGSARPDKESVADRNLVALPEHDLQFLT